MPTPPFTPAWAVATFTLASPPRLSGLMFRVRDQGRAPLGGNRLSDCGSSMRRKKNQPIARLNSSTRKTPPTITATRVVSPPLVAGGGVVWVFPLVATGVLVGVMPAVGVSPTVAVGIAVAVAVGETATVGEEDTTGGVVGFAVGFGVGFLVGWGDGVGVAVAVDVSVGVAVAVDVAVAVVVSAGRSWPGVLAYDALTSEREITTEITSNKSANAPMSVRSLLTRLAPSASGLRA